MEHQKCSSCRCYKLKDEFFKMGRPIKSCFSCRLKAKNHKLKIKPTKVHKTTFELQNDTEHLQSLIMNLEAKIDSLLKPVPKSLEKFVKQDCKDAIKFTDFIETVDLSQVKHAEDLVKSISKCYLAIPEKERPFYSRDKDLWVNLPWKQCDLDGENILLVMGEILNGNRNIMLGDDFVQELLTLSKI